MKEEGFVKQYRKMKRVFDRNMLPPLICDIENERHMREKDVANAMAYFEEQRIRRRLVID